MKSKKRPFVGREDLIEIFLNAVNDKYGQTEISESYTKPKVLVYHGIAGIGKTELRKKLAKELAEDYPAALTATVDFYGDPNRITENALFQIRAFLKGNRKIKFPAFDLAFAIYWKKSNPYAQLNSRNFKLWDESGLVGSAISLLKDAPVVDIIPKIGQTLEKGFRGIHAAWKKRAVPELQKLPYLEAHEILEHLPWFLAEDIRNHVKEGRPPVVLFFDTYEALWGSDKSQATQFAKDEWIRKLVENLPEAMFVITGREEVHWEKRDEKFGHWLDPHNVEKLEKEKCHKYLQKSGIEDEQFIEKIYKTSEGVPLYLALSMDTFDEIKTNQNREPTLDDFGGTHYEIFERFIRNLKDTEIETLKVLSCARKWNEDLFKVLIDEFKTGYPQTLFKTLCGYSFIRHDDDYSECTMHELMREHMQAFFKKDNAKDHLKAHEFLFNHHNAKLENIDIKNITDEQKATLPEAFYHASGFMDGLKLVGWLNTASKPFFAATQNKILLELFKETINVIEKEYGEENAKLGYLYCELATLCYSEGQYTQAELYYKLGIHIDEKNLGPDHPEYATGLNNLGGLYLAQRRFKEAEPLLIQAKEIRKKSLGENHHIYGESLNNLAELYRALDRYTEAEEICLKALDITEKSLGPDHSETAVRLNNLALIYSNQNHDDKAEPFFKRAFQITLNNLGPKHPETANRLNNLAGCYDSQDKHFKAEKCYKQALKIYIDTFGEIHPAVETVLKNMVIMYINMGKEDKAREYAERAAEIRRKLEEREKGRE